MKKAVLHELFVIEIHDLYDAEQQILEVLPQMEMAAANEDLKTGFSHHLDETRQQVERLDQIAQELDFEVEGEGCEAMEGLIAEGEEMMEMESTPQVQDLALISAARRIEHYEAAGYDTARMLAEQMGHDNAADLLKDSQKEEEETDKALKAAAEKIAKEIED